MAQQIFKNPNDFANSIKDTQPQTVMEKVYDIDEDIEYPDIDADYERAYGPVDNPQKYKHYLYWKKQGN